MKSGNSLYIAITFLITSLSFGQIFPSDSPIPNKPNVIYYPFYNGVQMIEIDYNNLEKARVDTEDQRHPISSIRPRYYLHNTILLRNKNGELLHQYNLKGAPFQSSDFAAVGEEFPVLNHSQRISDHRQAKSNYPSYGKYNLYVTENDKAGVIDTLGNKVLDVIYDGIFPYDCKYGKVTANNDIFYTFVLNGKFGLKKGKVFIEPKFDDLIPFKENVLAFKNSGKFGLINYKENVVLAPDYVDLQYKNDIYIYSEIKPNQANDRTPYGIINSNFKVVAQPIYMDFQDIVKDYKPSGNYWARKETGYGLLDKNGKEITQFKYGEMPANPYSTYYRTNDYGDSNKTYILDTNFREIGSEYDRVYSWNENLFVIEKNKKLGLIDMTGKVILRCEYESIENHFENNLTTIIQDGKYGVVNSNGKLVLPCNYNYLYFNDQRIIIHVNDSNSVRNPIKMGLFDSDGKVVLPPIYESLEPIGYSLFKIETNEKFGIVDNSGNAITPIKYDDILYFRNGYCIAKIDFGFGYINVKGKEITNFHYGNPTNFDYNSENKLTATAEFNGQTITIDEKGQKIAN